MHVLIAEDDPELGEIWACHLRRRGAEVLLATDRDHAVKTLSSVDIDVIILSLGLGRAEAESVADYAAYRQPAAKVIFVTASTFFSDGSVFSHFSNACACLPARTEPEDLAALVEYHAGTAA